MLGRRTIAALGCVLAVAACGGGHQTAQPPPRATSAPSTSTPAPSTAPSTKAPTPSPTTGPALVVGRDITRLPTDAKVVALTFDAGANADAVPSLLATLQAKNVPGTFFLTGQWAQRYPAQARQIADRGYLIGNHTADHPHLPTLPDAKVAWEVTTADAEISAATGRATTRPLFRFPYGDVDARTLAIVNGLGYTSVMWTVDAAGWLGTSGGMTVDKVVNRVMASLQPGCIVLMHIGSNPQDHTILDADALPTVIDKMRAQGYQFTTLAAITR